MSLPISPPGTTINGIGRCAPGEAELVSRAVVKVEVARAFHNHRAFAFYPERDIVDQLRGGADPAHFAARYGAIRNGIFDRTSGGDQYLKGRLYNDARLSLRLLRAIDYTHRALASIDVPSSLGRRIVLVKERLGVPTLCHASNATTMITHVGPGPDWEEISSIYLGLNLFDVLRIGDRKSDPTSFATFRDILALEARAIETGYAPVEVADPQLRERLDRLIDEILRIGSLMEREVGLVPEEARFAPFSDRTRQEHLALLNQRQEASELDFDYTAAIRGIESLEEHARQYKGASDRGSLRGIVELLTAAAGHDIHEVRHRANLALERIFAPKEYDAPLATHYVTLKAGDTHTFAFELPADRRYFLRLYRNPGNSELFVHSDRTVTEHDLVWDAASGRHRVALPFPKYGQVDYVVFRRNPKGQEWLHEPGLSGRVNVIPDIRGEIILEIFVDIHGHSRIYWGQPDGHPGLVYNEAGEVIRLGRFADVAAHLDDLKERYLITAIYLLGVQKRGSNREDWAPGATSPSPFSPISLTELEPSLGGESEFRALVKAAHERDIKVIVDIVPHVNRHSQEVSDDLAVRCYDDRGNLVIRASTDGRYGSWNDGKLLNYRKFAVWQWLGDSIVKLIENYDIDGIRFDSAHAVPIMMKKNNDLQVYYRDRDLADMVEGGIIVNEREDDHFVTTGFYDSGCRDLIPVPLHHYLMARVEAALRRTGKRFFINLAECYWGHERFLARSGIVPYNSALFKICENITHGRTDVREIYHVYDEYYPSSLPEGAVMLGILGNHDERRALNTFGHRGLRAAIATTIFLSDMVMDYEGNAEGENWKVYLDNIYVNWNQFESVSHRSLERFYRDWYKLHRACPGRGHIVWANNLQVVAAVKADGKSLWLGAFNFADSNQTASIQFDNPSLPIDDGRFYRVVDPLYSPITGHCDYYAGRELRVSHLTTMVSYVERVKLLRIEHVAEPERLYDAFFRDSFLRLVDFRQTDRFADSFAFREMVNHCRSFRQFAAFVKNHLVDRFWDEHREQLHLGLKRICFHLVRTGVLSAEAMLDYIDRLGSHKTSELRAIGNALAFHNQRGPLVFLAAEMEPFSKSGGLANVIYELPRQLVNLGEEVYVITPMYRQGADKAVHAMQQAVARHGVRYSGRNVSFMLMDRQYEVGVYQGEVDGIRVFLLDHGELFDGLYWGVTAQEKLRRRLGFARASAEVICQFGLHPLFTLTNDAFTGPFNGIVRSDPLYLGNANFQRTSFLHIIHNGGWQYFDAFHRYEQGFDLFNLFNLPVWRVNDFSDPVHPERLNCMAAGIRFADRVFTVSPSYAAQVQYACDGLEHILHNVVGISNGIGRDFTERLQARFDRSGFIEHYAAQLVRHIASHDTLREKLTARFPELLAGYAAVTALPDPRRREIVTRMAHKLMLQLARGLDVDPDRPLLVMIHRITEQKGFQLLLEASSGIFHDLGFQAILGGAVAPGDTRGEEIAGGLAQLARWYPNQVSIDFGFQDIAVPFLAGDFVGMPSMSEPGGLVQLEAFACGNLVVARATGGLRDTVKPLRLVDGRPQGNGFLFSDYTAWAFYDAMRRAAEFFYQQDDNARHEARENARHSVFYWDAPARAYIERAYTIKEIVRALPKGDKAPATEG